MSAKPTVLIIEDERLISDILSTILIASDYTVLNALNGQEALTLAASYVPDLILLDLGLPDMDGLDVLRAIRSWGSMPILVVSARQLEAEKVAALDAGADDYITKPFGNQELLARVRSALRRRGTELDFSAGEYHKGDLVVDFQKRMVTRAGNDIHLTPIEYKIVSLLAQNGGRVLTHEHILKEIWGPYAGDLQILRVNMANIRRKLEDNPADPVYLLTDVGVGYRMAEGDVPPA